LTPGRGSFLTENLQKLKRIFFQVKMWNFIPSFFFFFKSVNNAEEKNNAKGNGKISERDEKNVSIRENMRMKCLKFAK